MTPPVRPDVPPAPPRHKRFLTGHHERYLGYIRAAKTYLDQVGASAGDWLFRKPYDASDDHREFFTLTYNVLNLLQAMRLPARARVLEVGSGPGWLTEILMGLGHTVYALEPSEAMIAVARQRVAGFAQHYRLEDPPTVHFLCEALEECSLPDASADGAIFHEALHHVVDEERGLAQCARVLAPGGVLGVTGEGAWIPGDRGLEVLCEEEMARYGTLENPYTFDYLQYLLKRHGFEEVTRYHGVNGFFPEFMGGMPLAEAAQMPAWQCNHLTARKGTGRPTTANRRGVTRGSIRILDVRCSPPGDGLRIEAEVTNCGETDWLPSPRPVGGVRLSLQRGRPPVGPVTRVGRLLRRAGRLLGVSRDFAEAVPSCLLSKVLRPGESMRLEATYAPPVGGWKGDWRLDLVNENIAWFGLRVPVRIPA
jgi:SAM-dependent methyltransferase